MFNKTQINAYEVALVFENQQLTKVLQTGKYWLKAKEKVVIYNKMQPFTSHIDIAILVKNNELANLLDVVVVNDNEIALVYKNNLFNSILTAGTYAFWKEPIDYSFKIYNTDELQVPKEIKKSVLKNPLVLRNIRAFDILSNEKGLLFIDDKLQETLTPGNYVFWNNASKVEVKRIDVRQQNMELIGQEILTSDKANLRINFDAVYKITDINKVLVENKDYIKQLYTLLQMQLREYVGNLTLDEILATKEKVGEFIIAKSKTATENLGIKLINAGIRDIILPGDIKEIMNQVLVAQKRAQANMITRREETAATRSLLNTAKLMDDNEMLFKLKEMEYVEKIADKIGEITVSGNGGMVSQLKEIFSVNK